MILTENILIDKSLFMMRNIPGIVHRALRILVMRMIAGEYRMINGGYYFGAHDFKFSLNKNFSLPKLL
jgi:hypothetical protein